MNAICQKTPGCRGSNRHPGVCYIPDSPPKLHPEDLNHKWTEDKQREHNKALYGTETPNYQDILNSQDVVNHPTHYTAYKGLEIIDLTRQMNFNRGNAVKYIARAGLKDPSKEIEDLEKAKWYIQDEINRLKS